MKVGVIREKIESHSCLVTILHISEERNGTQTHIVRLLEYIEGDILASVALTPELSYQGGVFLAEFHHALEVITYVP